MACKVSLKVSSTLILVKIPKAINKLSPNDEMVRSRGYFKPNNIPIPPAISITPIKFINDSRLNRIKSSFIFFELSNNIPYKINEHPEIIISI